MLSKIEVNKDENVNFQFVLFIGFWVALFVECYALHKHLSELYAFSRVFIVPILFIRVFWDKRGMLIHPIFYIGLIVSFVGDIITYIDKFYLVNIGLNLYTASYVAFACFALQLRRVYDYTYYLFFCFLGAIAVFAYLWFVFYSLRDFLFYMQIGLHIVVLVFLLFTSIKMRERVKNVSLANLFLTAVILIIVANVIYGIDLILDPGRRYSKWLDPAVGFGNGIYLYIISKSALASIK